MEDCAISLLANVSEPWVKRLALPNYRVGEAARYAEIAPSTIRSWQRVRDGKAATEDRDPGAGLSYLQLIEIAVVAGCRRAGLSLKAIRDAREYISREFNTDYPFAVHQFATDGKRLVLKGEWSDDPASQRWISANEKGQGSWDEMIGRTLKTFDYEQEIAVRWHVGGENSPIVIDPRIAFGAPQLNGLGTWVVKDRWQAGDDVKTIASDFHIPVADVRAALQFERIDFTGTPPQPWLN